MKRYLNEIQINSKIIEINNLYYNNKGYEVKKTIKKNNIKYLFDNDQIKNILDKIALSAENFSENLLKQNLINKPEIDYNIDIGNLFTSFINSDNFLMCNVSKVFMFLVEYKACEYYNFPLIKKFIKKIY